MDQEDEGKDYVPVEVGLRVVRGPDWEWGNLDGGEGHVGTVVEVEDPMNGGRPVIVQWDSGNRCRYRCGVGGKYDLRVLDSALTGLKFRKLHCFGCRSDPLWGMQWKCTRCSDYQLCTNCYMSGKHSLEHPFLCIATRDGKRNLLLPRADMRKLTAYGLFQGALVSRGHDWRWGDQDGGVGNTGRIIKVDTWKDTHVRSVALTQWEGARKENVYRIGLQGKVDLVCVEPAAGGCYYPEHLPVPGCFFSPPGPKDFVTGDKVKADIDIEAVTAIAAASGNDQMNDRILVLLDHLGTVDAILENNDLLLRYPDNSHHVVSPEAATKLDLPSFNVRDAVQVIDDIGEVFKLQKGHGEWSDDMALSLGQVGVVISIVGNGDLRVLVNGRRWVMNPLCLKLASEESLPPDNADDNLDDHVLDVNYQLKSRLYRETNNPELIVLAAAAGDVGEVERFLESNPQDINTKSQGQTAVHVAVIEGFTVVLKVLLRFNPKLDTLNGSGESALHLCCYRNHVDCAKLLLDANVDMNIMDGRGHTPLMVAAAVGSYNLLRYLAKCPGVNLNAKDLFGITALHHSISSKRTISACILIEAGADPTVPNSNGLSCIHDAAGFGLLVIMEELMDHYPQHANVDKADHHMPLHVAAVNNRYDVVRLLCQTPTCDINAKSNISRTPLQCATIEGYTKIMWTLVGFGADINHTDQDGNTALHILLVKKNAKPPDEHTPQIVEVQAELLELTGSSNIPNYLAVACFLVQEGADIRIKNRNGQSPSQLFPPDRSPVLLNFLNKPTRGAFHGSLKISRAPRARNQPEESQVSMETTNTGNNPGHATDNSSRSRLQGLPQERLHVQAHVVSQLPSVTSTLGDGLTAPPQTVQEQAEQTPMKEKDSQSTSPNSKSQNISNVKNRTKHFPDPTSGQLTSRTSGLLTGSSDVQNDAIVHPLIDKSPLRQNSNDDTQKLTECKADSPKDGANASGYSNESGPCFLCEEISNVKFEPCGHIVMCTECSNRTIKCPQCRVVIESKVKAPIL